MAGVNSAAGTNGLRLSKRHSRHYELGCCTPRFACLRTLSCLGRSIGHLVRSAG